MSMTELRAADEGARLLQGRRGLLSGQTSPLWGDSWVTRGLALCFVHIEFSAMEIAGANGDERHMLVTISMPRLSEAFVSGSGL